MFEGYLEYGGVEVVNSRRVVLLSKAASVGWLGPAPTYPELDDALDADSGFDMTDPAQAPWYDANQDDLSRRFYGVYGLSMTNAYDSVKSTPVTQNAGDGGVLGASRKGTKAVVITATLLAMGADAMEFGRAWLQSVLDLDNCTQTDDCDRADVLFFSALPEDTVDALDKTRYLKYSGTTSGPFSKNEYASRGVYNTDVEWTWTSEKPFIYGPERDVALTVNPSLALISDSPINWTPYPSAELPYIQGTMTNLITNPSNEAVGASTAQWTNLSSNPSIETATTGCTAIPGTTGVAAVTSAAPATTTAYGTKVAKTAWTTASTVAGGGMSHLIAGIVAGGVYSFAFKHVKSSIANNLIFSVDWLNVSSALISNSPGNTVSVTAGAINTGFQALNLTAPALATQALVKVVSVAGGSFAQWSIGSFLEVDGIIAVTGSILPPSTNGYFDGATASAGDFTYAWTGAANASTSTLSALAPTGYSVSAGTSASAVIYTSSAQAYVGTKSVLMEWTVNSSGISGGIFLGNGGTGPAVVAGQNYCASGFVFCSKAQGMSAELQFYDITNSPVGSAVIGTSVLLALNTWTQLTVSGVAPAGAVSSRLFFTREAGAGGSAWAAGDLLYLDAVMLLNTATQPAFYFDGDLAFPAGDYALTWLGTTEASASTLQVVPVIARNANTNPSVESGTTNWSGSKTVVSGTDPGARFALGSSVRADALGTHSYDATLIGTGTGIVASSVTTMTITNLVSITAIPASKLVQLAVWAATAVLAGSSSAMTALSVTAKFLDVSSAQVGGTQTLLADARGLGVFSTGKIAIPAGATQVQFIISSNATWTDGTTDAATSSLRLYADGATVAYFGGV